MQYNLTSCLPRLVFSHWLCEFGFDLGHVDAKQAFIQSDLRKYVFMYLPNDRDGGTCLIKKPVWTGFACTNESRHRGDSMVT